MRFGTAKLPRLTRHLRLLTTRKITKRSTSLRPKIFIFVTVKVLKPVDEYQDIVYVAVKKTGGYSNVYSGSSIYDKTTVEKVGENIVRVGLSPYAGPSGANKLNCDFDLNSYTIR